MIPNEFQYIQFISKNIKIIASYATEENFVGEVINGYKSKNLVILKELVKPLKNAQKDFENLGFGILVYDSYRPVKAVEHFWRWKETADIKMKEKYYPKFSKDEIFNQGMIAKQSTHSSGNAVDIGLYNLNSGEELDMGTIFDFFDLASFTFSDQISREQLDNRKLLCGTMEKNGFKNFSKEWWHFSYIINSSHEKYWNFDII